ncbi:MAG: biosynthetic-type acetolactate synthase large subunit [Firmicutes bacterium]|jgi:acetolactate synthase-1/2/3 large subunit|nr:biosynthetic-type acetolactate synthase large subunit [Bacillota bacterium]
MLLTGAEILIECLLEQQVDTIFGYPGGAVLNIYDALAKYSDRITHYLPSHEQGAAHAADGYARSTGKVGVCLATSGPGATNLVTGIATAYMDSVPLVAITGNVALSLLGKDSFQEVDITGITMPITKHNFIVKNVEELASIVRKAFFIAQDGRPGPVLIDIPKDITAQKAEYVRAVPQPIERHTKHITSAAVEKALRMLKQSERPLIYVGGGAVQSDAQAELEEFVDILKAPVASSLMGLGALPSTNPYFCGLIGMHGTRTSNLAASKCDLLIAIGARFSDRVVSNPKRFAPNASILQIDIDPAEINKNIQTHGYIIGDVKIALQKLLEAMADEEFKDTSPWLTQINEWREKYPLTYRDGILRPQYIVERICALTKGEALITTEVGQNQIWAAQYYQFSRPRTFISSGGLGTMGFGLGAAIGAQIGNPDKTVINIAGDGSFRMNCNELATAVEYELPIIVVILNNHALGMVKQWQDLFYDRRFSQSIIERQTDFVKLAEAYGAVGFNLTRKEDVDEVITAALAAKRPVVINCEIDPEDKVFPFIPPGAAVDELIMEVNQ